MTTNDYRDISLVDAWRRVGYNIGETEVEIAAEWDRWPSFDSATEYAAAWLGTEYHSWRDTINSGIADAINDDANAHREQAENDD